MTIGYYPDRKTGIWFLKETSYGSTSGTDWNGSNEEELGKVTNFIANRIDNVGRHLGVGEGRNENSTTFGPVDINLTLDWQMLAFATTPARSVSTDLIKYIIGGISGAGSTADPYTIEESNDYGYTDASDVLTFQIEVAKEGVGTSSPVDSTDRYKGCIMTGLRLNATQGSVLTASADIVAQSVTSDSTNVSAFTSDTNPPWEFTQGGFKWGSAPDTISIVRSFNLSIAANPFIYRAGGDRFIQTPITGRRTYDWTLNVIMSSEIATTLRDDHYGQSNSFVAGIDGAELTTNDEIELSFKEGTSSGDRQMFFKLDQCGIISMSEPVSIGAGLEETTITGMAQTGKSDFVTYYKTT